MKYALTCLTLLAGLAVSTLAEDCDPNAPYSLEPYDGETTDDLDMTSQLIEYWSDSTCYDLSDGTAPNVKEQCKDICFPGGTGDDGASGGDAVVSSQSCNFGNAPWCEYPEGKPLLCGADQGYLGSTALETATEQYTDATSRADDHDWILPVQPNRP